MNIFISTKVVLNIEEEYLSLVPVVDYTGTCRGGIHALKITHWRESSAPSPPPPPPHTSAILATSSFIIIVI